MRSLYSQGQRWATHTVGLHYAPLHYILMLQFTWSNQLLNKFNIYTGKMLVYMQVDVSVITSTVNQ